MAVLISSVTLVLFDAAPADAASKPSVKVKSSGKSFTLTITNSAAGAPVYAVSVNTGSKIISSPAPADWTKQVSTSGGIKNSAVAFKTTTKPLVPGKTMAFTIKLDEIVYSVSWKALDKSGKPVATGTAYGSLAKILDILWRADEKFYASVDALTQNDLDTADLMASQAEDLLFNARAKLKMTQSAMSSGERVAVEKVLANDGQLASLLHRLVFVGQESNDVLGGLSDPSNDDVEDLLALTREMELLGYDIQSVAEDMDALATSYSKVLKDSTAGGIYKMRGYDLLYVDTYKELAQTYFSTGGELVDLADSIYEDYGEQSASEAELPSGQAQVDPAIVHPELARFFDGFDSDGDGELAIGEAQEFYNWVEKNITYRYDDENEDPLQGYVVGDGRKGFDYRQTPYETYKERAGDCEDTATLEQAFYSYFGVAVYVVGVNASAKSELDHAATIVLIGGTPDEFRDILGDLVYYDIESDNYDVYGDAVQEGTYMLVDNAYSNGFGYLSSGLEEGSFTISCYIPLEYGYGDEWSEVVDYCSIPFD
jgi:hypothetical protein